MSYRSKGKIKPKTHPRKAREGTLRIFFRGTWLIREVKWRIKWRRGFKTSPGARTAPGHPTMNTLSKSFIIFSVFVAHTTATGWKSFVSSTQHFSLSYPSSWYALAPNSSSLDILNFPPSERGKGVVIKKGGAEISVQTAPTKVHSVEEWIRFDNKNGETRNNREISVDEYPQGGCSHMRRVLLRSEAGPGVHFLYSTYYCEAKNRFFTLTLTTWEGDPRQRGLDALAERMTRSLRVIE